MEEILPFSIGPSPAPTQKARVSGVLSLEIKRSWGEAGPTPPASTTIKDEISFRLRTKCDVTRAETRFSLSAKRTSPFKSAGGGGSSVQSTAGTAEVCASAVVMLDTPCSEVV